MRTSNPALSEKTFRGLESTGSVMTIEGTVNKSLFLILLVLGGAYFTWTQAFPTGWSTGTPPEILVWYLPAILGAFVLSLVIIFKKTTAPYLAPVYAVLEGAVLGILSSIFEARYPGIVFQAVVCALGTFLALLFSYKTNLIRATDNIKLGICAATGGIALVYLIDLGLHFFGMQVPLIHESGTLGIGVSILITAVAAFNLVLDFDFIETGANARAPKYMEWYAAFGLLVTLVWLYIEMLRLLAKARKK